MRNNATQFLYVGMVGMKLCRFLEKITNKLRKLSHIYQCTTQFHIYRYEIVSHSSKILRKKAV